ncbi:hypothetical protein ACF08N_36950 [Streptomyces sp. NPDC015127]|uniref:hypothetical protein n=1 Tax=Streptomyces sp. NPDC015127 TaxID=3364939 RepID=UPI0036FF8B99
MHPDTFLKWLTRAVLAAVAAVVGVVGIRTFVIYEDADTNPLHDIVNRYPESAKSDGTDTNPLHDVVNGYLNTAKSGGVLSAYYGTCSEGQQATPHQVIQKEGRAFQHRISGSVESEWSAIVNVSITGPDESPTAYTVDLQRVGSRWLVCGVEAGSVHFDGLG